jgi:hypothetical protein
MICVEHRPEPSPRLLAEEAPVASEPDATWPLVRTLAWVILLVMAVALVYTAWIAIANFSRIGV